MILNGRVKWRILVIFQFKIREIISSFRTSFRRAVWSDTQRRWDVATRSRDLSQRKIALKIPKNAHKQISIQRATSNRLQNYEAPPEQ